MPASSRAIIDSSPSGTDSSLPSTPPPSLATDRTTTSLTPSSYTRRDLLALATPHLPPPHPTRLQSFSPILRSSIDDSEWGTSEDRSSLLDGEPVSKALPVPDKMAGGAGAVHPADRMAVNMTMNMGMGAKMAKPERKSSSGSESGTDSELLFHFSSIPERGPPVLVDFANPFAPDSTTTSSSGTARPPAHSLSVPLKLASSGTAKKLSAASIFQTFPSSVNSSSSSIHLLPAGQDAARVGREFSALRRRESAASLSGSDSETPRYADPLHLPHPFSCVIHLQPHFHHLLPPPTTTPSPVSTPTPPRPLPASLPARPGPLPPVFVKRESAALPQPMSLPDVAPLGRDWEGENGLSGNEKRRMSSVSGMGGALGMSGLGGSLPNTTERGRPRFSFSNPSVPGKDRMMHRGTSASSSSSGSGSAGERPERLAKLGQRLRESVAQQGKVRG
ncbi:hypothetical protein IAT38_005036 [Cryptococcus sp. DSM 104549]